MAKSTKTHEYAIFFRRWNNSTNSFTNATPRFITASTVREALSKFEMLFEKDVNPPQMTRVAKTVAVGEVETIVRPVFV